MEKTKKLGIDDVAKLIQYTLKENDIKGMVILSQGNQCVNCSNMKTEDDYISLVSAAVTIIVEEPEEGAKIEAFCRTVPQALSRVQLPIIIDKKQIPS